jgi:hypothetical protein
LSVKFFLLILLNVIFLFSCGKRDNKEIMKQTHGWKEKISVGDIPDFTVKGYMNGREVNFEYINFERWRGSNDNVINFSLSKPLQNCGYVENFKGFSIIRRGSDFVKGEWIKSEFTTAADGTEAYYYDTDIRSESQWNCALIIEDIGERNVRGKIILCFDDERRNWVGGIFEAVICNN